MSAPEDKAEMIRFWRGHLAVLLQDRNNLPRDDLEYVVEKASTLRDERFKSCVATLIGWSDDDRAELETFCAIALEVMALAKPSLIREAARIVEIKSHMRNT